MNPWIIVAIAVTVVIFIIMALRDKKLASEGKIIKRSGDFVEKAEDFILDLSDPGIVVEKVRALSYNEIKSSVQIEGNGQSFLFTGANWSARLYRKGDNDGKAVYSFQYLNWKEDRGIIQYALHMNMLLTSIEKMFLSIDPNTQVKTRMLEVTTKHKFF